MAPTPSELQSIRQSVNDWRKISDRLFEIGPLKLGLDGILTWIPGVGDAYGLGASAFMLTQAARAGASSETMTKMAVLLGVDAVVGSIPVAGDLFDMAFRAHARAARVLTEEIDRIQMQALPAPQSYPATRATLTARRTIGVHRDPRPLHARRLARHRPPNSAAAAPRRRQRRQRPVRPPRPRRPRRPQRRPRRSMKKASGSRPAASRPCAPSTGSMGERSTAARVSRLPGSSACTPLQKYVSAYI
jgi:hypothetical protein